MTIKNYLELNNNNNFLILFSLFGKNVYTSLTINLIFLVIFLTFYSTIKIKIIILLSGLLYVVDVLMIWTVYIFVLLDISRSFQKRVLFRLIVLFLITMFQYSILYAIVMEYEPMCLSGINDDQNQNNFSKFFLFFYFSIDLATSVGTGVLVPKKTYCFVVAAMNMIQGMIFISFIIAETLSILNEKNKSQVKKNEKVKKRILNKEL